MEAGLSPKRLFKEFNIKVLPYNTKEIICYDSKNYDLKTNTETKTIQILTVHKAHHFWFIFTSHTQEERK